MQPIKYAALALAVAGLASCGGSTGPRYDYSGTRGSLVENPPPLVQMPQADGSSVNTLDPVVFGKMLEAGKPDTMDQVKDSLVGVYASRTNRDRAQLSDMMAEETWMTAAEAVDMGFADQVTENLKIAAKFDAKRFRKSPKNFGIKVDDPPSNLFRAKLSDMQRRAKAYGVVP